MSFDPASTEHHPGEPTRGPLAWWHDTPLYLRILGGMILGVLVGVGLRLGLGEVRGAVYGHWLEEPARLIIRLLGALAPPLILVAIVHALMTAELGGRRVAQLFRLLVLNTVVAICVGLLVANVIRPGRLANLGQPPAQKTVPTAATPEEQRILDTIDKYGYRPASQQAQRGPLEQFLDNVPDSLLRPLVENNKTIGVIFVAVAFGIALRGLKRRRVTTLLDAVEVAFEALLKILHWIIQVVPIGVFGIVAGTVSAKGFDPFVALGAFILSVILALLIQAGFYLLRVRTASWVRPMDLIRGTRDALTMAFSTASSTATMPVTYASLRDRVGLREENASLGALVGANFNNDGTALYEAMAALFISQMVGQHLGLGDQLLVVLTSILASVGAAGIPEAGLVTMTLVFTAVRLDPRYIPLLFAVDWFLDRCRTTVNVMGDCNVSCLLDGKTRKTPEEAAAEREELEGEEVPEPTMAG